MLHYLINQSLNRILANEEAQIRAYQYYVIVCFSVPPTIDIENQPSRHRSVVCLSECCHDDQPGEWIPLKTELKHHCVHEPASRFFACTDTE